jgi:HPt (histidine-containing phosphotransfer) domain-containing protein
MATIKLRAPKVKSFATHQVITPPTSLKHAIRRVTDREHDDPVARAEQALANLSGEFKSWMQSECDRLVATHGAFLRDRAATQARSDLFRAAHDIKSDAATFGFPAAAAAAESLCRIIEHAPDLDAVPASLIQHHVDAILAIVRDHNTIERAGVARELGERLRAVADDYLTAVNGRRPDDLESVTAPGIAPAG